MLRNIGIKFILINVSVMLLWAQPPTPNGWEDAVTLYNIQPTVSTTPQITTNQNWVHTLCLSDDGKLMYRRSSNSGFNWEDATQISAMGVVIEDGYQIIADCRGCVYVVWFQDPIYNYTLWFRYSTDNGQTWPEPPRNIHTELNLVPYLYDPPKPKLTVDAADTVRLTFIYSYWSEGIYNCFLCYSQYYHDDSPVPQWLPHERIFDLQVTPLDARGHSICHLDNVPHVAFGFKPIAPDLPAQLYHGKRIAAGIWSTNRIETGPVTLRRISRTILSSDRVNYLHLVFDDHFGVAADKNIYYCRSTNSGDDWPVFHRLFGTEDWACRNPAMAINGEKIKVITTYAPAGDLYCQVSTNAGLNWQNYSIFATGSDYPWLTTNLFGYYLMFKELVDPNVNFTAYYDTLFSSTILATAQNSGRHLCRVPGKNLFNLVYESKGKVRYTRSEGSFADWQPFHKIDQDPMSQSFASVGYVYVPFGPIQPESAACVAYQYNDEIRYRWLYEPTGSWLGFSVLPPGSGLIPGPPSLITVGYGVCVVYPVYNPEHLPQYPFASAIYFNEFRYDATEPGPTTILAQSDYFDLRSPCMTLDGNYDLHVVWEDNDDGQVWYRMRDPVGWRPPEQVDRQPPFYPSSTPFVETYGYQVFCDWTEYPSGYETEIYENFTRIGLGDWPFPPANISNSLFSPSHYPVSCIGDFTVWAEQPFPLWDYDIRYYSKIWGYGWVNTSQPRSYYPHSQLWTDSPTEYWYLYTAYTEGNTMPYIVKTVERLFPGGKGGTKLPIYYKVTTGEPIRSRFCTKRDTIIRYNGFNVDYGKDELIYTLDFLDPRYPAYRALFVTYFEGTDIRNENIIIDTVDCGTFEFRPNRPETVSVVIPRSLYYKDHKVIVSIEGNPVTKANIILFQLEKTGSLGGGIQSQAVIPVPGLTRLEISPNPAKGIINILYNQSEPSRVIITLFDITGRATKRVYAGYVRTGNNLFTLDTKGLANGIYFLKLTSGKETITKKAILVK